MERGDATSSAVYANTGALFLPSTIPAEFAEFLCSYVQLLAHNGQMTPTGAQVPGSLERFGDPAFDTLLGRLTGLVSGAIDRALVPTYSFVRVYRKGQTLLPHKDRPSCEHSVTLHLGASEDEPWPVMFTNLTGSDGIVELKRGDGLAYMGCEVRHWREPCPVEWYVQAFLHFVDSDGDFAEYRFDRRQYLGLPAQR